MKQQTISRIFQLILLIFSSCCLHANNAAHNQQGSSDIIFNGSFEFLTFSINDTGIFWAGDSINGNAQDCQSDISSNQDCHVGRDVTHNDNSDGHAGFSYTKLDASGQALAATATQWACVKDNVTGLVWEVKTTDGSIHDKSMTFRWGGVTAMGIDTSGNNGPYYDNWNNLVNQSNSDGFCGKSNWRVPSIEQLSSLTNHSRIEPSIDLDYFPNTLLSHYWTSVPYVLDNSEAWFIWATEGAIYTGERFLSLNVRLVSKG